MSAWPPLNLHPDRATLQRFGLIALVALGALGACAAQGWWVFESLGGPSSALASLFVGVGLLAAVLSLAAPEANRPLYVALSVAGYPLGVALSLVVLATLYFGLITPLAWALRALGRDVLTRRQDRDAQSYWSPAPQPRSDDDYLRQY